jgi:hypothetical protein
MVLRKFVNASSNFPLEEIRQAVVTHQTLTENDPQTSSLIEYGRAQFLTHIVTHHILTKPQRSNPQPKPSLFLKQVSNIYLFPD